MTLCLESASMSITAAKLMQLGDWRSPEGTRHTSSNYSLVLPILPEVLNGCWKMRRWWQTNNTRMGIQKRRKGISNVTAGLVWANWQYFANLDFCETLWNQESRGILSWWTVIIRHLDWFGRYPHRFCHYIIHPNSKNMTKEAQEGAPFPTAVSMGLAPFATWVYMGLSWFHLPYNWAAHSCRAIHPCRLPTCFT